MLDRVTLERTVWMSKLCVRDSKLCELPILPAPCSGIDVALHVPRTFIRAPPSRYLIKSASCVQSYTMQSTDDTRTGPAASMQEFASRALGADVHGLNVVVTGGTAGLGAYVVQALFYGYVASVDACGRDDGVGRV